MPDPAAKAEVSRRGTEVMQARADPTTYLGGARAPKPTGTERAIGVAGQRIGVPALMAGRALPGGELGYQLMQRFAPEHTRAAAMAVEKSLAAAPTVPKWVPGIGGFQPVRTAMQIAPYIAGGAAGGAGVAAIPARVAGLMAVGAERGAARGVGRGMAPLDVAATAATGALEIGNIAGAFQVGGMLTPRGKWWRSLTPTQQAQRVMGLPAGPPPPPRAMQILGEKITHPIRRVLEPRVGIPRQYQAAQKAWADIVKREGGDIRQALRTADDFVARARTYGTPEQKATAEGLRNWTSNMRTTLNRFMEERGIADFQQAWDVARQEGVVEKIWEMIVKPKPGLMKALPPAFGTTVRPPAEPAPSFLRAEAGTAQLPSRKVIQERLQSLGVDALEAAEYATRIAKVLGQHGGDVVKAALAVGFEEGIARKLADLSAEVAPQAEAGGEAEAGADLFGQPSGKAPAPLAEKGPPGWKEIKVAPTRGPQPGEPGYAPPAVPGLFGQETAQVRQPGLWGERGVNAVWRKVEGVDYVKIADGHAVTRADGSGPAIALDEPDFEDLLKADARKAAPPSKPAPPVGLAPGVAVERGGTAEVAGAKVGVRRQGEVRAAPNGSLHVVDSETGEASSLEGWGRADLSPDQATAFRKHMAKKFPPEAAPAETAQREAGSPAPTKAAEVQARKLGIDLAAVRGTGRKGQILRKDVLNAEKVRKLQEASARVGAPLRPGTIIEQTRQALEEVGAAPLAKEGVIAPPRGREAAPQPQKPPIPPVKAPPAAPEPVPGQEEAVPMEVLAKRAPRVAPTVQAFDRMTPDELVRMLGKIRGPIGSLAKYKEVGEAVEELRDAMKREKAAEAAAKEDLARMQAAYPGVTAGGEAIGEEGGGLLGLLGESRIVYGKGVELGVEIQEAVEGLPKALRRHFIHVKYLGGVGKLKGERGAGAMTIENLQMRWLGSVDVPQKAAPSLSETFDRLMTEIKAYEAARAEGALSTEDALRRLARTVPEDVGAELVTRADALAAETTAVEAVREKVLAAAEPYLAVGGEGAEIAVVEMPEAAAAAKISALRRRMEDLRARATGERTLSQALREDVIRAAREMARRFPKLGPRFLTEKLAAVDSPKQAEALIDWMQKHAAVAERRAVRVGVEKRMTRLRTSVGMLEEPYHTLVREALDAFDPARPRERTVRGIESTIGYVGEHPEMEALLPRKRLRELERLAKKPLADLDVTELRDLDGYFEWWERLAETKGRLKIGQRLRDYFEDVEEGETQILASGLDVPAHRRAEGTWRRLLKRGVLDVGTISRDLGGASDPVDRALDADAAAEKDSQATRYLARNLWEGERDAKELMVSFLKRVFAACEAADLPFGSKALIAAMEERVTVELPTATDMAGRKRVDRVTTSAAELAETVLDYEDPNTVRQASLAGDCWGMPRTKDLARPGPTDPKIRLGVRDVAALRDALAARPKVQQIAYTLHEIYNDPATFRKMDDAVFELDMRHLIKEGPYHPRSRNWPMEGSPRVPESFSDMRDVFLEHLGPAQARTGGGMAVVHGNLFSKAMNHFTVVSRIIGLARAVRGAWMFLDSKEIKRAMINRHGTGLPDFYKAIIRNLMGTGITQPSTTEAVARKMMHRFAVAALGLRVQTGLRQVWSTWNTADVLGADAVALGYKNFLSHRKESLEELKEASPIAWLRLHYYGGTDALLSGPSATIEHQYGKKTLGEKSLVLVRMGDGIGVGALWEAAKAWGAKHGVTDTETLGRLWEDLLNEEGAGPTTGETYQSLLATEARRSVLARIGTFFGNFRNRIVNKIWKRVIDVRNDPGNPEVWKKLFRALVVVLLGTTATMVGVGAGTRWVLSGGKRRPTGTSLALDAIENSVGNVYLMGDTFYAGRRVLESGTVYGAGTRQNPLARVVTSWIQGAGGVYLGVDQAISGERFKAGARRGERKAPRTLGRAASQLAEAVGYSLGLPVAPLAYWRSILRFAEGEGEPTGEKAGAADLEALAWKASGGDAAAVEKLKAAGVTYIEARRALRAAMQARGEWSAKAWFERGAALRKAWYAVAAVEGGIGSRPRARSFGLGLPGSSFGARSARNIRFPDFLRKTVPAVGAPTRG